LGPGLPLDGFEGVEGFEGFAGDAAGGDPLVPLPLVGGLALGFRIDGRGLLPVPVGFFGV
jgi:hypothetical protein